MDTTTKNYVVYVKETRTKKYFVNAESEQEAEEKYILDGLTSSLYDKETDREIIYVGLANKDNA
tara:strand:- start:328 stop:519 length:192 start_codon:yes stop_codon:yes gene_type:complete